MDFFDLHCDTPSVIFDRMNQKNVPEPAVSLSSKGFFGKRCLLPAVFVDDTCDEPFKVYLAKVGCFKKYAEGSSLLCTDAERMSESLGKGETVGILSVENGRALGDNADNLYTMYRDGVRVITLTWNGENGLGGGCGSDASLKSFGRDVIDGMNSLNMAVDLAHANEQTFYEALDLSLHPICTHTACRAVKSHPRNLNDGQIKALASHGGLIGICFYSEFLGSDGIFDLIFKHLYHLLDLGVENNIAIGSDFDGCETVAPLKCDGDVPALYEYLLDRGIGAGTLSKIFFENAFNYFNNLLTNRF